MSYSIRDSGDPTDLPLFESLRGNSAHLAEGYFIAESPKIVETVLESKLKVRAAMLTQNLFERFEKKLEAHDWEIQVTILSKEMIEKVVGYPLHQGAMLAVSIPESPSIETLLARTKSPRTIVALDSIADAENMGGIIRTCAAFGVTALIVDDQCCHPFLRRSVRVSMGTIVDLPIIRANGLLPALIQLKASGFRIIGASLGEKSKPIDRKFLQGNIVMVFGAEGHGMRAEIAEACDEWLQIPISSSVDSLNVGVACGIFLHERAQSI
jgi:tRNA G18 (ribose-2'-O)-methylase SpoU